MRVGTAPDVKDNKKSRDAADVPTITFGEKRGVKESSAQITALYRRICSPVRRAAAWNLAPIHIGSVKSELRALGTDSEQGVARCSPPKNGDRVF